MLTVTVRFIPRLRGPKAATSLEIQRQFLLKTGTLSLYVKYSDSPSIRVPTIRVEFKDFHILKSNSFGMRLVSLRHAHCSFTQPSNPALSSIGVSIRSTVSLISVAVDRS